MIFLQEILEVQHPALLPASSQGWGSRFLEWEKGWGATWHSTALFGYIHPQIPGPAVEYSYTSSLCANSHKRPCSSLRLEMHTRSRYVLCKPHPHQLMAERSHPLPQSPKPQFHPSCCHGKPCHHCCFHWESAHSRARLPTCIPWLGNKTPAEHWVGARIPFADPVVPEAAGALLKSLLRLGGTAQSNGLRWTKGCNNPSAAEGSKLSS